MHADSLKILRCPKLKCRGDCWLLLGPWLGERLVPQQVLYHRLLFDQSFERLALIIRLATRFLLE